MISREEALNLVKQHVIKPNLIKHILAVESIMRGLAKELNEDIETWGLVGLLHDVDFEKTYDDPKSHSLVSAEILKGKISDDLIRTIKAHNFENTGVMPEKNLDYVLIAADAVSGLIVACALIMPMKKLADVNVNSVLNHFKQKDFARNCNRENMLYCEKVGLTKEKFFEIALNSLKEISDELGL